MTPVRFRIEFGVHVIPWPIDVMLADSRDHREIVPRGESNRTVTAMASRISKLRGIKCELAKWEREGHLRWSEEGENSD